ncbi:hypothetical protein OPT61_g9709 [Boeremia exigua]|uniref:Uncharacterized protein n=1 Tax=Boeremia exigua TaxID=749465 RepID=A0ACC2HTR6_9PLEO|nr:hypothetical protein OPT61_g9709 [Boeremia exigua]
MPETVISKYPLILATVATRKEGMTRKQFREHNETIYAPLLKKVAGKVHPLTWTRRYHVEDDECPTGIPMYIIGTPDGLDWDCFGEMTFVDELHYQQFVALLQSDHAIPVLEEEEKFCDAANTKVVVMRRDVSIGERAEVVKLD